MSAFTATRGDKMRKVNLDDCEGGCAAAAVMWMWTFAKFLRTLVKKP